MTSQQTANEALALYQANRNSPEIESLMDAFFNFPTREEYEAELQCVRSEMSCVITGSPSSLPSSAHSLSEC